MVNSRKRPKRRQLLHLRKEIKAMSILSQESASVSENEHQRNTRPEERQEQRRQLRLQMKQRYDLRSCHHVNKIKNKNVKKTNIVQDKASGPSARPKMIKKKENVVQDDKESSLRKGSRLQEPGSGIDNLGVPKNSRGSPRVSEDSKDDLIKSNTRKCGLEKLDTRREETSMSLNTVQDNEDSSLGVRPKVSRQVNFGNYQSSSMTRHYGPHSVTFIGSNSLQQSGSINKSCFRCGKRILIITTVDSLSSAKEKVECSSCAQEPVQNDYHVCGHCDRDFVDESALLRHYELHLGLAAFRCPTCRQRFPEHAQLEEHSLSHIRPLSPNEDAKQDFFAYFLHDFEKP
ncbi:zinc finger and SCAN domain-containing protein 30 [Procambarus clarkii]|uniref:zinc finger and SCAN domain-containing protein 30 n=1 Tax=Procambarus clarkii TaxID=6728 RepID=UPI003742DC31